MDTNGVGYILAYVLQFEMLYLNLYSEIKHSQHRLLKNVYFWQLWLLTASILKFRIKNMSFYTYTIYVRLCFPYIKMLTLPLTTTGKVNKIPMSNVSQELPVIFTK